MSPLRNSTPPGSSRSVQSPGPEQRWPGPDQNISRSPASSSGSTASLPGFLPGFLRNHPAVCQRAEEYIRIGNQIRQYRDDIQQLGTQIAQNHTADHQAEDPLRLQSLLFRPVFRAEIRGNNTYGSHQAVPVNRQRPDRQQVIIHNFFCSLS